jgi:uncharacterized protein (TIGR02270 family)
VLDIVAADAAGALTCAAISALGWLAPGQRYGLVQPLLNDRRASVRALGLGACAVHRVDPGAPLDGFLEDELPVRLRAMQLAGAVGRADLLPHIVALDTAGEAEGSFRQAWSAVLLGERGPALERLKVLAARPGPRQRNALELAVLAMAPEAVRGWIGGLGAGAEALGVRAAGPMGLPDLVPWLIGRMPDPMLARAAGESFSLITGADLGFLDLDTAPAGDEGPNDDPSDPDVELDADLELAVPHPAAITAWWAREDGTFRPGQRHVLGQLATEAAYFTAFGLGYQRQRRIAALALALIEPRRALPNWRAREPRRVFWKARSKP